MTRVLLAFLALSTPLFAQNNPAIAVFAESGAPRVEPGSLLTLIAGADNRSLDVDAHDVVIRVRITAGTFEDLTTLEGTATCTFSGSDGECRMPVLRANEVVHPVAKIRVSPNRNGGRMEFHISITAREAPLAPSLTSAKQQAERYRIIGVSNASDSGDGSFRAAIDEANRRCSEAVPCKIIFELSELPATITPLTPLPRITADRVFIDAGTTPRIVLDGSRLTEGNGLEMYARCDAIVRGLAIGNFPQYGIRKGPRPSALCNPGDFNENDQHAILDNHLGLDETGTIARPNLRGIDVEGGLVQGNVISGNRRSGIWIARGGATVLNNMIGTSADGSIAIPNGASGIFAGPGAGLAAWSNTIWYNREMGIAASSDRVLARQNSMGRNGEAGIDIGLDGPSPQTDPPVVLSAIGENGRTVVTIAIDTTPLGPVINQYSVDLFTNYAPDADGERWLTERQAQRAKETLIITVDEDLSGQWINATLTRSHWFAAKPASIDDSPRTSEFSNTVQVQ